MFDRERTYYTFQSIEAERNRMLHDHTQVPVEDLGAGSRSRGRRSRVCDIAKTSLSSPAKCAAYFRLAVYHQPEYVVEVGTSLGISTAYIAAAHRAGHVYGLEGSQTVLAEAKRVQETVELDNITFVHGNFDQTLAHTLVEIGAFDLAFLDGNHRLDPTLAYFQLLKEYRHNDSIIIVDDIRWSPEMWQAWIRIKEDEDVTASVDVFSFGMLFFRKEFGDRVDLRVLPSRRIRDAIL